MDAFFNTPEFATRYGKRLAIVVPYRDRQQHLANFLPHMRAYFQNDKLDRHLQISLHIVEQTGPVPFNRGKLMNCGYHLSRGDADYVCFHDVDYLPIWADYSWSASPARLIWNGLTLAEDWEKFFGGVVLFDKPGLESINGFPNSYWGWGFEDAELRLRLKIAGQDFERRDGTYRALPHKHAGYSAPGVYSPDAQRTGALYESRRARAHQLMAVDGLSSLSFKLLRQTPVKLNGAEWPNAFHYLVDIGTPG